jgi:hypothetical protein
MPIVSRRFLSTSCLLVSIFAYSCGKKIQSSEKAEKIVITPALGVSVVNLKVGYISNEDKEGISEYQADHSGWAKIPNGPEVIEGSPLVFSTRIFINTPAITIKSGNSELYCDYTSIRLLTGSDTPTQDGYNHYFKGCKEDVDNDGVADEMNYLPGDDVPIDEGKFIILHTSSSEYDGTIQVHSDIEVDWH